jgi:hypothetical protein
MGWIFIPRPQQFSMSLTPHQSLSPCNAKVRILDLSVSSAQREKQQEELTAPLFAGLHAFANTLKNGVLPSAVLASETLLMYTLTGPQCAPPIAGGCRDASVQDLSPVCWCISTATVSPALTAQRPATAPRLMLQRMLLEVTSVRGLLEVGMRTQVSPWSTPLIQRSWKVAWEATCVAERAVARARRVDLMVAVGPFEGVDWVMGGGGGLGSAQADGGLVLLSSEFFSG